MRMYLCPIGVLSLALGGCLNVPQNLSTVSTLDLCEMHTVHRPSEESQRRLQTEVDRRKADCGSHRQAIQARHDEDLYDRTYRNQSP